MHKNIAFTFFLIATTACRGKVNVEPTPVLVVEDSVETLIVTHLALSKLGPLKVPPESQAESVYVQFSRLIPKKFGRVVWAGFNAQYDGYTVYRNRLEILHGDSTKQLIKAAWLMYTKKPQSYSNPPFP